MKMLKIAVSGKAVKEPYQFATPPAGQSAVKGVEVKMTGFEFWFPSASAVDDAEAIAPPGRGGHRVIPERKLQFIPLAGE